MAAKTLGDFTLGTTSTIQTDDFIVGYDTAVAGGERRWTLSTIANAVSGLIKDEMQNYMNNTLTLGNYPYLEYAWVCAPNTAGQSINSEQITTVTIDTEVADLGNYGSISGNQITLAAGTYQFSASVRCSGPVGASTSGNSGFALYNVSDNKYVTRGYSMDNYGNGDKVDIDGQFTITTSKTFDLRFYNKMNVSIKNTVDGYSHTITTPLDAEQRTTIKLWKVG